MTTFGTTPLANIDIKMLAREQYITTGLNQKAYQTSKPGIYNGFEVSIAAPNTQLVFNPIGGDSVAVVNDLDLVTVAERMALTVQLASSITTVPCTVFPPGSDTTLWAVLKVNYSFPTTVGNGGEVLFADAAELAANPGLARLCRIFIPTGSANFAAAGVEIVQLNPAGVRFIRSGAAPINLTGVEGQPYALSSYGTGDTILSLGASAQFTDAAAPFLSTMVGGLLTLGSGWAAGNKGTFRIISFINASNITYDKIGATNETVAGGVWTITTDYSTDAPWVKSNEPGFLYPNAHALRATHAERSAQTVGPVSFIKSPALADGTTGAIQYSVSGQAPAPPRMRLEALGAFGNPPTPPPSPAEAAGLSTTVTDDCVVISGATNPTNNGVFPILNRFFPDWIEYYNPDGVAEILPGGAAWKVFQNWSSNNRFVDQHAMYGLLGVTGKTIRTVGPVGSGANFEGATHTPFVAALADLGLKGGTVLVLPGTYVFGAAVTIPASDIHISGLVPASEGAQSPNLTTRRPILRLTDAFRGPIFTWTDKNNFRLSNLTLDDAATLAVTIEYRLKGVLSVADTYVGPKLTRCAFTTSGTPAFSGGALILDQTSGAPSRFIDTVIRECFFESTGPNTTIRFEDVADYTFEDNEYLDTRAQSGPFFYDDKQQWSTGATHTCTSVVRSNRVTNTALSAGAFRLGVSGAPGAKSKVEISGNRILGGTGIPIAVETVSSDANCDATVDCTGNDISWVYINVGIDQAGVVRVKNNKLIETGTVDYPIAVDAHADTRILIASNNVAGPPGLLLVSSPLSFIVTDNVFDLQNGTALNFPIPANGRVCGNTFRRTMSAPGPVTTGMLVSSGCLLANNLFDWSDSDITGITDIINWTASSDVTIESNTFLGRVTTPRLGTAISGSGGSSHRARILSNKIQDFSLAVLVVGISQDHLISDNTIYRCPRNISLQTVYTIISSNVIDLGAINEDYTGFSGIELNHGTIKNNTIANLNATAADASVRGVIITYGAVAVIGNRIESITNATDGILSLSGGVVSNNTVHILGGSNVIGAGSIYGIRMAGGVFIKSTVGDNSIAYIGNATRSGIGIQLSQGEVVAANNIIFAPQGPSSKGIVVTGADCVLTGNLVTGAVTARDTTAAPSTIIADDAVLGSSTRRWDVSASRVRYVTPNNTLAVAPTHGFQYTTPQVQELMIPGSAFRTINFAATIIAPGWQVESASSNTPETVEAQGGCFFSGPAPGEAVWPFSLPDGAEITAARVYFGTGTFINVGFDLRIAVLRMAIGAIGKSLKTGVPSHDLMPTGAFGPADYAITCDETIDVRTVNNNAFGYCVWVSGSGGLSASELSGSIHLKFLRITYQVTSVHQRYPYP